MPQLHSGLIGGSKYQITNAVRLRGAQSLSRASGFSTGGASYQYLCIRCKRAKLGSLQVLFSSGGGSKVYFDASDSLVVLGSGGVGIFTTGNVYRDTSAWYTIEVSCDGANATDIYVNGAWAFHGDLGAIIDFNPTLYIGRDGAGNFFEGDLAEVVMGTAWSYPLMAAIYFNSFGAPSPRAVLGVLGGGARLMFDDASSAAALGYDTLFGNNFTVNGLSVTPGENYDSITDTPTNNYCVLNPLWSKGTLSKANLNLSYNQQDVFGTFGVSAGEWWFEYTCLSVASASALVAVIDQAAYGKNNWTWTFSNPIFGYRRDAFKYGNGAATSYGATWTVNDVIGVRLNMDAGTIEFYKQTGGSGNFVSQGVAFSTNIAGRTLTPFFSSTAAGTDTACVNFGQRPFNYVTQHGALPGSAKAWCTSSLPAVTVPQPSKHFDVLTRTGTGATFNSNTTRTIAFQPDLDWTKCRGTAGTDHVITDSVRGVTKQLFSDLTNAEQTDSDAVTAFNSDGFSGGTGVLTAGDFNTSARTYVDWLWKAGGNANTFNKDGAGYASMAAAGITDGSIAATGISVNTTAGISVVTFTGTGANGTVAHGLGKTPAMIIVKDRDTATGGAVYHVSLTSQSYYLKLFQATTGSDAEASDSTVWQASGMTTNVFSVGASTRSNANTKKMVAYVFAEIPGYSKFGRYLANASADGPVGLCMFSPKFLLLKNATVAERWYIHDAARESANQMAAELAPDQAFAEGNLPANMDFLATGFKVRDATDANNSTNSYIFAAFAEHPFGGSNVAPSPAR